MGFSFWNADKAAGWTTPLRLKVNLHQAINFRALLAANLVTLCVGCNHSGHVRMHTERSETRVGVRWEGSRVVILRSNRVT